MKTNLYLFLTLLAIGGCLPVRQVESPVSQEVSLTYSLPSIQPVEGDSEIQERRGVVISVLPAPYAAKQLAKKTCELVPRARPMIWVGANDRNSAEYVVTSEPAIDVSPAELTFFVSVTNRTTQVLKLEGTILKLNVDGREVVLTESSTKAFLNGVLTPNEAQQFTVIGPAWSTAVADSTMSFKLAGVPVELDKAGNVVERGNFMWTYKARITSKNERGIKATEHVRFDPVQASERGCSDANASASIE